LSIPAKQNLVQFSAWFMYAKSPVWRERHRGGILHNALGEKAKWVKFGFRGWYGILPPRPIHMTAVFIVDSDHQIKSPSGVEHAVIRLLQTSGDTLHTLL